MLSWRCLFYHTIAGISKAAAIMPSLHRKHPGSGAD
jgi:hypothetical protein